MTETREEAEGMCRQSYQMSPAKAGGVPSTLLRGPNKPLKQESPNDPRIILMLLDDSPLNHP